MNAYIFDMDGTILSSIEFWKNFGTEVLNFNGISAKVSPTVLEKMTLHEGVEYLVDNYPVGKTVKEVEDGLYELVYKKYRYEFELKEGTIDLFREIKDRGHMIAISTATERRYVDGMLKKFPEILEYTDFVDCVEIGGYTKKDTEYFEELLERFKEKPDKVFFFEDSPYSIRTANKSGFITIALLEDMNPHLREEGKEISKFYFENLKSIDKNILEL